MRIIKCNYYPGSSPHPQTHIQSYLFSMSNGIQLLCRVMLHFTYVRVPKEVTHYHLQKNVSGSTAPAHKDLSLSLSFLFYGFLVSILENTTTSTLTATYAFPYTSEKCSHTDTPPNCTHLLTLPYYDNITSFNNFTTFHLVRKTKISCTPSPHHDFQECKHLHGKET